jgi:hypothetical protein
MLIIIIQKHVNEIIAAHIPPELPQWQITMIPADEDTFYLLVRIHHLYSSEDGVGLNDLLLLKPDDGGLKHGETAAASSSSTASTTSFRPCTRRRLRSPGSANTCRGYAPTRGTNWCPRTNRWRTRRCSGAGLTCSFSAPC